MDSAKHWLQLRDRKKKKKKLRGLKPLAFIKKANTLHLKSKHRPISELSLFRLCTKCSLQLTLGKMGHLRSRRGDYIWEKKRKKKIE